MNLRPRFLSLFIDGKVREKGSDEICRIVMVILIVRLKSCNNISQLCLFDNNSNDHIMRNFQVFFRGILLFLIRFQLLHNPATLDQLVG